MVEEPFTGAFVEDILAEERCVRIDAETNVRDPVRKRGENGEKVRDVDFRRLGVDQERRGA